MKLCIPTESDEGLSAKLATHFGVAPFFTMVDGNDVTIVPNPSCHHSPGGCHHLDILRTHGVEALACGSIGRRAFEALEKAGIRVFASPTPTVAGAVAAVHEGTAAELTIREACHGHGHEHGHGHQHRHQHRHGAHDRK